MTRPATRRTAACLVAAPVAFLVSAPVMALVLTLVALCLVPAPSAEAAPVEPTPFQVTISSLSPSTLPARGTVTISGTITNRSTERWTGLQAYMLTSGRPITTSEELAGASASDPAAVIGSRVVGNGLSEQIGDLAPGDSTGYSLTVSRKDLGVPTTPGVYWIGVHVLGGDQSGYDNVADGRARTFIPQLSARSPRTSLALVMPLQGSVRRGADGRLRNTAAWNRSLASDGRLHRLLDLSATATRPMTWAVDPAVVDAARSLADGNPETNTGPPSSSSSPSAASSPSASASSSSGSAADSSPSTPEEQAAGDWVQELQRQASSHAVMAVPYGSLDVAAAYQDGLGRLVRQATNLSTQSMTGIDVPAAPLVDPPTGFLPAKALARIGGNQPVLMSQDAFPTATRTAFRRSPRGAAQSSGQNTEPATGTPVVLTDTSAGSGGPVGARRYDALEVRQRILSDAVLHALSPHRRQPLVVSTPQLWNPGTDWQSADFFDGLDVPWLRQVGLPSLISSIPADAEDASRPTYPAAERRAEVPYANLVGSADLSRTGEVFANLLQRNDTVDDDLGRLAMLGSSTHVRAHPEPALVRLRATTAQVLGQMQKVHIEGPPFVVLSSDSGTFQVTIINDLDESVNVGIRADTGGDQLTISAADPVVLGPGQRASMRLRATSTNIGVHRVTLMPVTAAGQPLGNVVQFNVRSSQVGLVIWVIMGVGAVVLLLAIAIRVNRRVAQRKKTHGPLLKGGRR